MSLLDDLDVLRQRTRADRRAYAFPLFLFGALILLAPLLYATYPPPRTDSGFVEVPVGQFPQFTPIAFLRYPDLVGWYWVTTVIGGLWLTGWWYRRRARQRGVETDLRVITAAAIAALLGFLVWQPVFETLLRELFDDYMGLYSSPALNLPILFGSAALAAAAGLWCRRRTGWERAVGVGVTTFLATVTFGAIEVYLVRGHAALVIIAVALLGLAWVERSVLLGIVGGVFTAVALLVNLSDVDNALFTWLGWYAYPNFQVSILQAMLLPGVVLLVGGVAAVIGNRR
jgi:hypothetical protein